ncbi:hypothetical protein VM94_00913 [Janthinobacterium sp. KBS0711]|uniref:hypothetical protein n=1 Tax=Janthinobacterium sp. KBS0711 TaxID=1649647 RepID=UPI000627F84E|nr:hypothetical protein [Janthinobacterium sp. KBS0711]KKO65378.1 hypothetical protein VM94_00913 [Janthinobacterium sp. KBS0711]TSD71213.1 hypothetical protein FFI39_009515 [Janthinobacterium sp. KBS0711]
MSDHVDNTDKIIFAEVARGLAAVRSRPGLVAHGCCHYCDEPLAPALLFCNVDCRDDYDKEQGARTRAGRPG